MVSELMIDSWLIGLIVLEGCFLGFVAIEVLDWMRMFFLPMVGREPQFSPHL